MPSRSASATWASTTRRPPAGSRPTSGPWPWPRRSSGRTVRVFCVNHEPGPTAVEHDGPVEVTRFGRRASAAKLDFCPGPARRLRRVEADILHLQVPNPTMILALLGRAARGRRWSSPIRATWSARSSARRCSGRSSGWPIAGSAAILPTSPTIPAGSPFLRPYADRIQVLPHRDRPAPYLDPSPRPTAPRPRDPGEHAGGPIWLGCGPAGLLQGVPQRDPRPDPVRGTLLLIGDGPDRPGSEAEAERARASATGSSSSATCRTTSTSSRTTSRPTPSGSPRTPGARRSGWSRSRRWPAAAR